METPPPPRTAIQIEMDTPVNPTPTLRSAVTVPRSGIVPVAAPRTITAATAPTVARSSTRAAPTPAPPKPHRTRCSLCCRSHRLQHYSIFKGMLPVQRQKVAQAHCLQPNHVARHPEAGWSWRPLNTTSTRNQLRPQPHHPTGLSGVVATLRALQRLLG
ncbi:PREDICTED: uncharacterized protein LOC108974727 [Bactrocera latifrons]|uniref:uncharacterized protein LOC108974727 n=1 Tax=Bactrocera latifrons TaxID=174628 RepID=UPI0008DD24ED|nr:PREDICTED: uncharacterized protein LOC108974727 [Bactrocera latifrons]